MNDDDDDQLTEEQLMLIAQLPSDSVMPATWWGEYGPQGDNLELDEYTYPIKHDKVLVLPKNKYTEERAQQKFVAMCLAQGVRPTEAIFYTGRFWCMRVIKLRVAV